MATKDDIGEICNKLLADTIFFNSNLIKKVLETTTINVANDLPPLLHAFIIVAIYINQKMNGNGLWRYQISPTHISFAYTQTSRKMIA